MVEETKMLSTAYAEEVVGVHDERVLRDAFPHGEVARLFPVHIGEARLRSGAVGVHDVAVVGVAAEDVGDDFAEGLGEEALVNVLDGGMHIFFHSADTAHHVSLVLVHCG